MNRNSYKYFLWDHLQRCTFKNPSIVKQTTQWPKEKIQKDKTPSIKYTHKTKDRLTRTPLKPGWTQVLRNSSSSCSTRSGKNMTTNELRCSGRVAVPAPLDLAKTWQPMNSGAPEELQFLLHSIWQKHDNQWTQVLRKSSSSCSTRSGKHMTTNQLRYSGRVAVPAPLDLAKTWQPMAILVSDSLKIEEKCHSETKVHTYHARFLISSWSAKIKHAHYMPFLFRICWNFNNLLKTSDRNDLLHSNK
jgi:hypothetical protein